MNPTTFKSTGYKKSRIHKEQSFLFCFLDSSVPYKQDYLTSDYYLTEFIDENDQLVIVFEIPTDLHLMATYNNFHLLTEKQKKQILKYTPLNYGVPSSIPGKKEYQICLLAILRDEIFIREFGRMPEDRSWINLTEDDFYNY